MSNNEIGKNKEYFSGYRDEMLEFIPETCNRILEVGCGEGKFAYRVKELTKCEAWGIDTHEESAHAASKILDKVLVGDFDSNIHQLPTNAFDVVILNDVLEHMVSPFDFLEKIKNHLSPAGCLVISIPNVRFFRTYFKLVFKGDWEYESHGVLDITHLRFFTGKSIRNTLERHGYDILQYKPINKSKSIRPLLLNILSFGLFPDSAYRQFALVAKLA